MVSCSVGLVCLSTMATPARGADAPNVLTDYRIASWTEEDGLPPGTIWAIVQDDDGFLWLGTDAGLVRFDGARFVAWSDLGGPALPSGSVRELCVSRDGSLWVGFGGSGGIVRIQGEQTTLYGAAEGLPDSPIGALVEDHGGVMWAGTREGLFRFTQGRWQEPDAALAVPTAPVFAASMSRSGDLLVVADSSVFMRPRGRSAFQHVESSDDIIQSVAQDGIGRVWITDLFTGFRQVGARRPRIAESQNGKGSRLLADRRGNLWVATFGQGLWRVRAGSAADPRGVEEASDLNGLSNNVAYALLEDREGNIWVGTTDGLNRLTQQKVTHVQTLGLVTGLESAPDGSMWAATSDGLVRLSAAGAELQRLTGFTPRATHVDARGTLWVATDTSVLRLPRGATRSEAVDIGVRQVRSIASDPHGGLWLVDVDQGLVRWAEGRLERVAFPAALSIGRTTLADRSGTLWIASSQGRVVSIGRDGRHRVYGRTEGLDTGNVRAIYEDRAGALWLAGSGGLSRFEHGRFTTLKRTDGLPVDSVTGVVEDETGALWVGTASGVVRLDRVGLDNAVAGEPDQAHFAVYDSSDGVAGTVGWIGQGSAACAQDGRLWFLTANGITIVDPRSLEQERPSLPVRIEQVAADDRRMPAASLREIPSSVARVQISYTVPNLTSPRRTRFRYRLEGFDAEWIEAGRARQAVYTNLPPRDYRFVVEASAGDGMWESTGASWAFAVTPAFYETRWFLALVGLTVAAGGWTAWRIRVRQVRKQFALMLGERVRLSREIHDTLLQSLVGVALQCDALANDPELSAGSRLDGLARLRKQVEGYIRECRQSIWDLRSPALEQYDLVDALRDVGQRACEAAGVRLEVDVRGTPRRAEPRVEEQLLRIGQEAITNAARHAQARHVRLHMAYGDDHIELRVTDDGRGFDPEDPIHRLHGHCGLISMKERAETVGGFNIRSRIGGGTEVVVVAPTAQHGQIPDDHRSDPHPLRRRSPGRAGRHRADHQPAA